ncbi:MAG: hypothetical protein JO079_11565 [Frankiaceae bacterium]|nr:hypothetical protein [Frankiaceae bacterium]MBV9368307.1 hypothetical protein [Frankiales bacterium]
MMTFGVATVNIVLGLVYSCYGVMTILDLKHGWRERGFSHFGLAWIAMAFTCGPHHLEHGLHAAATGTNAGLLDVSAVLVGFPAGVAWFLLRVEALAGGRGDRFISGTPKWLKVAAVMGAVYAVVIAGAIAWTWRHGIDFTPRMTPNVLLLFVYCVIGYYLLGTQLGNRQPSGGWSVSGVALTAVFPTCGAMHVLFATYAASGKYVVDPIGLTIDWLAVPAAIYFVWVVRALHRGSVIDWNEGAEVVRPRWALA